MRTKVVNVVMIVLAFVIGGVFTFAVIREPGNNKPSGGTSCGGSNCGSVIIKDETGLGNAVANIYDAVVMIRNYQNGSVVSTGTGFVYKTDDKYGYIMTNNHVISGGTKVTSIFTNDEEVESKVLGSDIYLDLAVIQVPKDKVLKVAEIGNSENSRVGDTVFTAGSPLGYEYRGTVTDGILSGKDRLVTVSTNNSNNTDWVMKVLQTNAAVNPGNSGGPLVNVGGQVIGIISLKLVQTEVEGMGFAIPIEYAMSHIGYLEQGKPIERPMLGTSMINADQTAALMQNGIILNDNVKEGVVIIAVVDGSGADKAGLKKGDIITKIGNVSASNVAYLKYELYKHNPGEVIDILYLRDGKEETTKVTLGKA
ncbi:MAG: trypsin-like peptidase domain-containing protein [Bacilli bacterium]